MLRMGRMMAFMALIIPSSVMAQSMGTVAGTVTDASNGDALTGANISVIGQTRGVTSNIEGSYSLSLPAGTYQLRATFVGFAPLRKSVTITAGQSVALNFDMKPDLIGVDDIVVLGTRSTERTVIESTVPVDIISRMELEQFGFSQTTAMIRQLVPSFNSPKSSVTDGTDHINPATLRGLGPDQVLVLVNGKRRHTGALVHLNGSVGRGATGVDLNAIPSNMIERIEVLRDGAAAQYGSDAIAGVINIVLKKDKGLDASMTYGQNYSVEQRGYKLNEALAVDGTPQSWAGNPAFLEESVTYTDGKSLNLHLGYGGEIGNRGNFYIGGQYRNQDPTNRAGLDPRQLYAKINNVDDPREATANRLNHKYGSAELQDLSMFYNAEYDLTDNMTWYAFGGLSNRQGRAAGFFRRAWESNTAVGFSQRNTLEIYPDGFLPHIETGVTDFSLSTGTRGDVGGWRYDLSETIGRNRLDFGVNNSLNASLGSYSPSKFYAGALVFTQASTNLDLVRSYEIGTASPLSVGVGGEFRYENYQIEAGEAASYVAGPVAGKAAGAQVFPGFTPRNATDKSRSNVGAYVDLENEIISNLLMGAAVRFENYSDFGSILTGKLSGRYEILEGLAVRGAASTGYRAPSLAQSNFSAVATNFINGIPFEIGTFPVSSPAARALGAVDLEPETSVNLSGGVTYTRNNFSLTADYYNIAITDRVVVSENFTGSGPGGSLQSFLQSQGVNATGGRFFTNAVDSRTSGVDIIARYALQLSDYTLRTTLAANITSTEITNKDEITTPDALKQYTAVPLFGRVEQGRYESSQPGNNFQSSFNLSRGNWDAVVRVNRFGVYKAFHTSDPKLDQEFGAKVITDLELSNQIAPSARFAVGVNNLFDVYPDRQLQPNSNFGMFQYSSFTPFGFDGRYMYTRLLVNF
jgi:iron complex outermembrane receptor protein